MTRMFNTNLVMILAIIGILVFSSANNVVVGQCPGMEGLITQCSEYVEKSGPEMSPSPQCCHEIENADTPCLCQHFNKAILQFIDIQKVIYVARSCGKPIPSGTTCGGIYYMEKRFNQTNFVC